MFALRITIKTDKLTHLWGSVGKFQSGISQSVQRLVHGLDDATVVPSLFSIRQALCSMCSNGLFPVVKRPGNEADRSYPTTAKVQMNGAIPPLQHTPLWHE